MGRGEIVDPAASERSGFWSLAKMMARGAISERSARQRLDRQDSLRAKQNTLKSLSENRGPFLLTLCQVFLNPTRTDVNKLRRNQPKSARKQCGLGPIVRTVLHDVAHCKYENCEILLRQVRASAAEFSASGRKEFAIWRQDRMI